MMCVNNFSKVRLSDGGNGLESKFDDLLIGKSDTLPLHHHAIRPRTYVTAQRSNTSAANNVRHISMATRRCSFIWRVCDVSYVDESLFLC